MKKNKNLSLDTPSTKYIVWNKTDNISTHFDAFSTKEEAEQFAKQFRERYRAQGYYRDNQWNKIAPEDIQLEIINTKNTKKYGSMFIR